MQVNSKNTAKTAHPNNVSDEKAIVTQSRGNLLRRAEAARLLGVSVSTLRRSEGELIKPIVGPDGVHLFEESEIRSVMVTRRRRLGSDAVATNGGVAADVFELLDANVHPVDIVKRLRLPPDVVITLRDQWTQMRGGFVVTKEEADMLSALTGTSVAKSGRDLVGQVSRDQDKRTQAAELATPTCRLCAQKPSCVCAACLVENRGPLVARNVGLEKRTNDRGMPEVRIVVARAMWDEEPFEPGSRHTAMLRSDWIRRGDLSMSDIADAIEERESRINSARQSEPASASGP
jgi:hypothetical protein